jgi:hypothetical protein
MHDAVGERLLPEWPPGHAATIVMAAAIARPLGVQP